MGEERPVTIRADNAILATPTHHPPTINDIFWARDDFFHHFLLIGHTNTRLDILHIYHRVTPPSCFVRVRRC